MKNIWLGGILGIALGGSMLGGYIWYDHQKGGSNNSGIKQLQINDVSSTSSRSKFLDQDIVDARLSNLSFKEIMRLFYKDQMRNVYVQEDQLETTNYVGLTTTGEMGEEMIALMHPILNYRNTHGEARFLIIIEKLQMMNDGIISSCHGCSAEADLYTFKQLENGQYQVVSRTPAKGQEFGGSYGRVHLDREQLLNNMQPLGKQLTGTFYQTGFSNMGESMSSWHVLHLPEDTFIGTYFIADASGDNSGSHEPDSPLHFSFESDLQIKDNAKKYFPIQVNYIGDRYDDEYTVIEPVQPSMMFNFNEKTGKYAQKK